MGAVGSIQRKSSSPGSQVLFPTVSQGHSGRQEPVEKVSVVSNGSLVQKWRFSDQNGGPLWNLELSVGLVGWSAHQSVHVRVLVLFPFAGNGHERVHELSLGLLAVGVVQFGIFVYNCASVGFLGRSCRFWSLFRPRGALGGLLRRPWLGVSGLTGFPW